MSSGEPSVMHGCALLQKRALGSYRIGVGVARGMVELTPTEMGMG